MSVRNEKLHPEVPHLDMSWGRGIVRTARMVTGSGRITV